MTVSLAAKIGCGFALAGLAAMLVPRLGDGDTEVPALATLLLTGVAVGGPRRLAQAPTSWKRVLIVAALAAALLVATGGLPLLLLFGGFEYVGYVLASGVSLLVALALAGAVRWPASRSARARFGRACSATPRCC